MNGATVSSIINRLPSRRWAVASLIHNERHLSYPPMHQTQEQPAVFAVPSSYLDKTSTWYAWGDIPQKRGILKDLLALTPSTNIAQNDDGTQLAGILDDKNLLGNALSLTEAMYEQMKTGGELPTSISMATGVTVSSAGASRAIRRLTSRIRPRARRHRRGPSPSISSSERTTMNAGDPRQRIQDYIAELRKRAAKSQDEAHRELNPLFDDGQQPRDFIESSFLYIRSCDVDNGSRPLPCQVFWLSPDIRVMPLSNLGAHTNELRAGDA